MVRLFIVAVGCAGDFCNFDVSLSRVTDGPSISNLGPALTEFRKKLLNLDNADVDEVANESTPRVRRGTVELPFRCIVRAREDTSLVRLVLQRHCDGKPLKQAFAASELVEDTILGEFPGRCYGSVRVCFACFCVYDMLERARKPARVCKKKSTKRLPEDLALVVGSENCPKSALTPETLAIARAQQAISQLDNFPPKTGQWHFTFIACRASTRTDSPCEPVWRDARIYLPFRLGWNRVWV